MGVLVSVGGVVGRGVKVAAGAGVTMAVGSDVAANVAATEVAVGSSGGSVGSMTSAAGAVELHAVKNKAKNSQMN